MVAIYVALIIAGRRTFESVPAILQPSVQADLEALGLGTDGKPLT
ncbi:CD1375 family protein [Brevibacillus composti]|nr:CD1375 family protein [Brevibacillus composti]